MIVHVFLERSEVGVGALAWHEAKLHQLAGRVVDEHEECAGLAAVLEPAVIAAVDLDKLSVALAAQTGLVEASTLLARLPEAFLQHPCPQGLAAYLDVMLGEQNFNRQRRSEVRIPGPDQLEHVLANTGAQAMVRRLTAALVDQP